MLTAKITDFVTDITRTVNTQEEIAAAAARLNLKSQSQTVDTTFWQPDLIYAFGPCADNEENNLCVLNDSIVPHKDAQLFGIGLLEATVQPVLLKTCCPINQKSTSVDHKNAWDN